ncbi:hypothetical protein BGX23_007501 [Mortierella sp. AD031]|nr:hypothetical protein BGX23_007501 [Mortierella sp. AD031]
MKFVLFRHGHSLANQESRIVSSLENGTRTTGGPEGTGFGLSAKGRLEVAESAKSLADYIITTTTGAGDSVQRKDVQIRILTSPFQRTLHTASIIEQELDAALNNFNNPQRSNTRIILEGGSPVVTPDLRERFFGEFEMQTPSDHLYTTIWTEDARNPFHELYGVESVAAVTNRVTGVIREQEQGSQGDIDGVQAEGEIDGGVGYVGGEKEVWVILVSHGDSLQILQTALRGWSGDRHRQLEHLETANWRVVDWCDELKDAHRPCRSKTVRRS